MSLEDAIILAAEKLFQSASPKVVYMSPENYRQVKLAVDRPYRKSAEFRRSCGERALAKLRATQRPFEEE